MLRPNLSLGNRLWLVLALAILPILALSIADYRGEKAAAILGIETNARLILENAQIEEAASLRQIRQTLRTMAGANDMHDLDPGQCSALAQRMLAASEDYANLGAVTPDGLVFCSAKPADQPVSVSDRQWFRDALATKRMTRGEFVTGRISGEAAVVFGYPLYNASGQLQAIPFLSSNRRWFERQLPRTNLPAGWSSMLLTEDGVVLVRHPDPERWRNQTLSDESRRRLADALGEGRNSVIMSGIDGVERLFQLRRTDFSGKPLVMSVAAPLRESLDSIEQQFRRRLGYLAAIVLFSLLAARFSLYRLIERWIRQMAGAAEKLAQGDPGVRLATEGLPPDLAILNERFNEMADALEKRQHQYLSDRLAIETLNRKLTNRLSALEAAEQNLRLLSTALEQSPSSIIITDLEANIVYVNEAFARASGYSASEVQGRNPRLLESGQTPAVTYQRLWATLNAGQVWRGEFINRRKDGSLYTELAIISPVRQADGRITSYVAVQEDVTERRRVEAELEAYHERLEQLVALRTRELALAKDVAESANRAKSSFLANMSHEIRTPMNAIIGLNYLLQQSPLTDEQRDKLAKVAGAAEHLLQIINDILDLSKIESGKMVLERQAFSPRELLQTVAGLIREAAAAKGLQVFVNADNLPGWLYGDAARLRQALLNFASNAVKFTLSGSITLSGQTLASDDERIICRFSVADTGIGIRQEDIPRLFKVFEQLDPSTTRRFGGTGLGLAISRHLAELMHGEVGVDSTPGRGSTFWITAQLEKADAGNAPGSGLAYSGNAYRLIGHILLADDEPINCEISCDLLTIAGLQVSTAKNGLLAVDRCRTANFDLILMDIQMPELDGLEATRQIRRLPAYSETPIIALTANAFAEDRARCLAAGMTDFLAKPVNPEAMYEILGKYLPHEILPAAPPVASGTDLPVAPPDSVDPAGLANALAQLIALLRSGNLEAQPAFARLARPLHDAFPAESRTLATLIAAFDYENASPLAEALYQRLS